MDPGAGAAGGRLTRNYKNAQSTSYLDQCSHNAIQPLVTHFVFVLLFSSQFCVFFYFASTNNELFAPGCINNATARHGSGTEVWRCTSKQNGLACLCFVFLLHMHSSSSCCSPECTKSVQSTSHLGRKQGIGLPVKKKKGSMLTPRSLLCQTQIFLGKSTSTSCKAKKTLGRKTNVSTECTYVLAQECSWCWSQKALATVGSYVSRISGARTHFQQKIGLMKLQGSLYAKEESSELNKGRTLWLCSGQ